MLHTYCTTFTLGNTNEKPNVSKGLPSAPSLGGNPHTSRRGPTHHPEGPKPSPAAVGPARLRVRGARAGRQPPCHGSALQQHQCAVPEQLGMASNTPSVSLTAVKWGRQLGGCVGKVHRVHHWIPPEVRSILRRKQRKEKARVMSKVYSMWTKGAEWHGRRH